jgi:hypothetical protein
MIMMAIIVYLILVMCFFDGWIKISLTKNKRVLNYVRGKNARKRQSTIKCS